MTIITDKTGAEPYLVVLRCRLQVVHEQLLVLWQQGEHHCQPIEDQQEAFGQRSLVWKRNTRRGLYEYNMLVVLHFIQLTYFIVALDIDKAVTSVEEVEVHNLSLQASGALSS